MTFEVKGKLLLSFPIKALQQTPFSQVVRDLLTIPLLKIVTRLRISGVFIKASNMKNSDKNKHQWDKKHQMETKIL